MKWGIGCLVIVIAAAAVFGLWGVGSYNSLVTLDQAVQAQWGQVQNVYQRRLDLVPNLVETVKGAAAFEKDTFTAVAEARSRAGQVSAEALQNVVTIRRPSRSSSRPRPASPRPSRASWSWSRNTPS
jgi:hypothetical protein